MATPSTQPLTPADLKAINQGMHTVAEVRQLLEQAKAGGLDVAEYEARAEHLGQRLIALKSAFFPNKP